MSADAHERKRRGAWDTPPELVDRIVDAMLDVDSARARPPGHPFRVLDPACGDGRFLAAVAERLGRTGERCPIDLVGVDVHRAACDDARRRVPTATIVHADALGLDAEALGGRFDLVIGNPPFLSQLSSETARGGSSVWGGGPYADAAVEFLALADAVVEPVGGRVAFVLPQSVLAARDAGEVRRRIDGRATMVWSTWSDEHHFDAQVHTCAVGFEYGRAAPRSAPASWAHVVTDRTGVPPVPVLPADGADRPERSTLGDVAWLNANFRDEYYALVPAVGDEVDGPPLITSGLIDPGVSRWGTRAVRFAKRRLTAPRVDLTVLDQRMREWAAVRMVPKVLVANQTRIVEAVCDPCGAWLPGVPVVGVYPNDRDPRTAWSIAAVLSSPFASAWAWSRQAGTGLSASAIRLGPAVLGELPWPGSDDAALGSAVTALRAGDLRACGDAVEAAYGLRPDRQRSEWWRAELDRIERRASGRRSGSADGGSMTGRPVTVEAVPAG